MRSKVLGERFQQKTGYHNRMKFTLSFEKKNGATVGTMEGHNHRLHATQNQLPESAWFTKEGIHEVMPFNAALLAEAKTLAKRKDAVLAVEFVFQAGNQTDWRDFPTSEHLHGKAKTNINGKLNDLINGAKEAAIAEFGKERIISIALHTDESTPHVHVAIAPIKNGKLQAKNWINGHETCAQLRERLHSVFTKHFECTYEKGVRNSQPHDPARAAGNTKAPKPKPNFISATLENISKSSEIKALKEDLEAANQKIQNLFSALKKSERDNEKAKEFAESARNKAIKANSLEKEARDKISILENDIKLLTKKLISEKKPELSSINLISEIVNRKNNKIKPS